VRQHRGISPDRQLDSPKQQDRRHEPRALEIRARPPVLIMCRGPSCAVSSHRLSIMGIVSCPWGKPRAGPRGVQSSRRLKGRRAEGQPRLTRFINIKRGSTQFQARHITTASPVDTGTTRRLCKPSPCLAGKQALGKQGKLGPPHPRPRLPGVAKTLGGFLARGPPSRRG